MAAEKVKTGVAGYRIPNSVLFGWLPQARPCCGPRRRWKDACGAQGFEGH